MAIMGSKGGFTHIVLLHQYLMIPLQQVQFREPTGATQFIQQLIYGWNWEAVLGGNDIQGLVINAKSPRSITFFD